MKYFILNNGIKMPVIGLGTFPMKRLELFKVFFQATSCGYTSFDTSSAYGNERWLGLAQWISRKQRDKLFFSTKLSNAQQREGNIRKALENSLKLLKLDYIDLYLMHWPNPETYLKSWKEMEKLYEEKLIRAIGVCNFHEHHLNKLFSVANIIPAVNQIELHPLLSQKSLINFCRKYNIQVEAYSPLARMNEKLIKNKTLIDLSKKYNKTISQIIFRWNYQNNIIVIPKTSHKNRLIENIDFFDFEISSEDIKKIDLINCDFRVRHNPDTCDFTKL
ncbi:aldo/keto reductase family protein [Megamonas funiformis]|jgi:diketogulonate reductase-like aldo/keto reductase|uniref:aldo/keto reductase family protein n=1 Tax=Megamonas funiformis TaxID=437897 RepID=UPI0022E2025B|nr:aldo/keto reductase [Megamonas funiformis]